MWISELNVCYDRRKRRYSRGVTIDGWIPIAPLILPARRDSNKRTVGVCEVVSGVMYNTSPP